MATIESYCSECDCSICPHILRKLRAAEARLEVVRTATNAKPRDSGREVSFVRGEESGWTRIGRYDSAEREAMIARIAELEARWEALRQWVNDSCVPVICDTTILTKMLDLETLSPGRDATTERNGDGSR